MSSKVKEGENFIKVKSRESEIREIEVKNE